MRRRSKSVGRSAKTRLRQTAKQKGPHGSITQRGRISRSLGRETEIEPLTHELNAITEQQRATTEVLKLISSSFGDPQPVLPASWQVPFGSAMPTTVLSGAGMATLCILSQHTISRRRSSNGVSSRLTNRTSTPPAAVCWRPGTSFTSSIWPWIRLTLNAIRRPLRPLNLPVLGRCSWCRCGRIAR